VETRETEQFYKDMKMVYCGMEYIFIIQVCLRNTIFFHSILGQFWLFGHCFLIHSNSCGMGAIQYTHVLVSFKKYMPPPLPYFKVNIYPFPLPHFASIFFAYLWSFRRPNYIVTLSRYFSFRLPHLNIPTGPPSDKLDKNSQRKWLIKNFSQWNGYDHFRFALDFSYAFGIL
jgi:hypothetical protein